MVQRAVLLNVVNGRHANVEKWLKPFLQVLANNVVAC